jgi:flagellar biosynthesis protein FlhA
LRVVDLSDAVERRLGHAARASELRPDAALGPDTTREMVRAVAQALGTLQQEGHPPVIVCSPEIRTLLKDLTRVEIPRLAVLSRREIPRDLPVDVVGSVVEQELPVVTRVTTERVTLQGIR